MKRREFISLVGCAVAMWPHLAEAQQKLRRIGVLFVLSASDPENQARLAAFIQGLRALGWTDGHNIQFDVRGPAKNQTTSACWSDHVAEGWPAALTPRRRIVTKL